MHLSNIIFTCLQKGEEAALYEVMYVYIVLVILHLREYIGPFKTVCVIWAMRIVLRL